MLRKLIGISMAALVTLLLTVSTSYAGKVLLKVPVWFPTTLPALGTSPAWVAKHINAIGGDLTMKTYEPKKLVPPKEMLEAVSKGQVNAGYTTPGYNMGKLGDKGAIFSAVPFGPDAPEFLAWVYYGNGRTLWQKTYDDAGFNVQSIPCGIIAPETSGWFSKEIKKPSDLKGLRMRFFGLGARVMEKLGVATSQLPGGEIVPALQKGAIDATEFSMPAIDKRLGINKILKYNYFPGWHQPATLFDLIVNKDTWNNEMSEGQRTIVELACRAVMADALAMGEAMQFDTMKENAAAGTINKYWSKKMLATFKEQWDIVVAEMIAKDPAFKVVWDDLQEFRANYAIWNEWAYLPRPGTKRSKK
ncbi:MAG: TRAP transporter substrate-binding protein [Pelagibacteraceae bacterium]|jgi:TRAP-type mannitol/chloroaromatic compound transport system substrate-binding protein|nr:C4-dicarboxylate ABC transporter [Candidatus Pelagibacter sp.]MDP6680383.1 TRAP transporter substrate-binding protein [Pelagibacteraceae bacterium]MDP6710634.1 TRAP transporter substrate-binding protein [Pelagibacteraceae bacterium]